MVNPRRRQRSCSAPAGLGIQGLLESCWAECWQRFNGDLSDKKKWWHCDDLLVTRFYHFVERLSDRADNLVLVIDLVLERPSFFRRLGLDLVLKTSNSARLVLLKSNEHAK